MRFLILLFISVFSFSSYAADITDPKPLPPPPVLDPSEAVDEPQITIKQNTEQTVEEYRSNGRLYMIKVTPKHGRPYYLVDDRGDGKFARQESLDSGLRVPMWLIFKF
jgi:hypothetical protein